MTDETSRPTSEDTPAPPASTRWAEEPLQEDDALASPFVPGRSAASTTSKPTPSVSGEAPAREAPRPEEGREGPTPEAEPDDFPFDHFDLEGEAEAQAPGAAPGTATEVEETDAAPMGWTPADLNNEDVAVEEPAVEEPAVEEPAVEARTVEPADEASAGAGPAREAAEVLERLAELLRSDGLEAVREEMQSPDRLTSLLAGLVAGYVTGRS